MRETKKTQLPLMPAAIDHPHARELVAMSTVLSALPEYVLERIRRDLIGGERRADVGRNGMSAEMTLRALIVKQMNGYSYDDLAFHLQDSLSYRTFCLLGIGDSAPSSQTLQRNIKSLAAETLELVNRHVVLHGRDEGVEDGEKVRVDSTVTEANIHYPTDSSLLWDCTRVLTRLLHAARQFCEVTFCDRTTKGKRRMIAIQNAKNDEQRTPLYQDLYKVTEETTESAERAAEALKTVEGDPKANALIAELWFFIGLAHRVLRQTRRRVFAGEKVPADEKLVSIFEPHTDIIAKERRETQFGHKLFLTTGKSGLVLDCFVVDGNPADSNFAQEAIARHIGLFDAPPSQAAFDGGFASQANLSAIKNMGVQDVAFSKGRGIEVQEMTRTARVYKRLKDFRAGIEGCISFLKRSLGLARCTWRGFPSFKAYAMASVVAGNLLMLARRLGC